MLHGEGMNPQKVLEDVVYNALRGTIESAFGHGCSLLMLHLVPKDIKTGGLYRDKSVYVIEMDAHPTFAILRIADGEIRRMEWEQQVYQMLRERTCLPVPEVYHLSTGGTVSWMLMQMMDGVSSDWLLMRDDISKCDKDSIQKQKGRAFAEFAECAHTISRNDGTVQLYLNDIEWCRTVADRLGLGVDTKVFYTIENTLRKYRKLVDTYVPRLIPVDVEYLFVHGDSGWLLSGVIDVELCRYSDARAYLFQKELENDIEFCRGVYELRPQGWDQYPVYAKVMRKAHCLQLINDIYYCEKNGRCADSLVSELRVYAEMVMVE